MTVITPELLLHAYAMGVFPMAEGRRDPRMFFVDPDRRGVLPLDRPHLPRSLRKTLRSGRFEVRCDTCFAAVLRGCAEPTATRPDTWINAEIEELYLELHARGHAHSLETFADGVLVGGLYGVALGAAFFGESMFSRATDASKVALAHLLARLRMGGFTLLDTQFITDHLRRFGTIEIPRAEYRRLLAAAIAKPARFPADAAVDIDQFLAGLAQSSTQMS
ncbi:MAG: leucyl/phenylalanyl-tRNA--protein transferase [Thalassobaculales bacterium]